MIVTRSLLRCLASGSLALAFYTRSAAMSFSAELKTIPASSISYLDAITAKLIDNKLMQTPGFSIDQLMELAGYSVACSAHDFYTSAISTSALSGESPPNRKVVVFSGPGNNGGDGLVAARHLKHFGYEPSVVYPKKSKSLLFDNLVQQCQDLDIHITDKTLTIDELNDSALIIDAIFGFSFQGPARDPFSQIIDSFNYVKTPVLSVDIPSGWHVDEGDIHNTKFTPAALISLTLPKKSTRHYKGTHYVGGRFVHPLLQRELNLDLPDYGFGSNQVGIYCQTDGILILCSYPVSIDRKRSLNLLHL